MKFGTYCIAAMLTAVMVATAGAAVFNIEVDGNDRTWRDDGTAIWVGQRDAGIGYDGSLRETAHVMVFELPDLGGEAISTANLLMHVWDSMWGNPLSLDLYGVRVDASGTTAATDFYRGPWDTSGTNGTPIMQAFASKSGSTPFPVNERNVETDATADAALAAWLTSLYANGAQAGDFVFLRLGPDTDYISGSNSYIYTDTGNTTAVASTGSTYIQKPLLTIETVPEPATIGLLGLGAMALIRRKR